MRVCVVPINKTIHYGSGNGIGLKIIGGKEIPGTDGQIGAYVAAIYPGGVADQLHGELQEGGTQGTVTWYWSMLCLLNFLPTLSFIYMYIRQVTQLGDVLVVAAPSGRR